MIHLPETIISMTTADWEENSKFVYDNRNVVDHHRNSQTVSHSGPDFHMRCSNSKVQNLKF